MKKATLVFFLCIMLVDGLLGQVPEAINYQAVARDGSGNALSSQPVNFRLSILQGSPSGTVVYSESQTKTTNQFGLANIEIGKGAVLSGNFSTISWGTGSYFLKTEMDPSGGSDFILMGTSQFLSVPYAEYAKSSGNGLPSGTNGQTLRNNGCSWITDETLFNSGTNVGIGTTSPESSAILELNSSSKGMLPPRMTEAQMNAIPEPVAGLLVFCTDCCTNGLLKIYTNGQWKDVTACTPANSAPVAGNVTQSGTAAVGNTLSCSYTYFDADNDPELTPPVYQWYRANDNGSGLVEYPIGGATYSTYLVTLADEGKFIRVGIRPRAQTGVTPGNEVKPPVYAGPVTSNFVCGDNITVHHSPADSFSAVTTTIIYHTVALDSGRQCWITKNIGSYEEADTINDNRVLPRGWFFQFNRKQGLQYDNATIVPPWPGNTPYEVTHWNPANDPCQLLGGAWRIPSWQEWIDAKANEGWTTDQQVFDDVRMHFAGFLVGSGGTFQYGGALGRYWSTNQRDAWNAWYIQIGNGVAEMGYYDKSSGLNIRCMRDIN